jgi:microcystin-dependent protein
MPLILPNDFVNGETADAVPVEQNYQLIENYLNTEVIGRDGTVAMAAPLLLHGDPTQVNHAANKGYVDALLPVGMVLPWPAPNPPAAGSGFSWLICNGASVSTSTYPKLYAVLGFRYGGSGGSFLLPNLIGRVPIGLDASRTAFNTIGKAGGSFTVPVPAHAHAMSHSHEHPHTHPIPHTHSIAHDHPAGNTSNPLQGHRHDQSQRQNSTPGTTGSVMMASATGTTIAGFTGNDDTVHQHQFNTPPYAGDSGPSKVASSSAASEATTGGVSTPNTASTGTASVELIPPFVIVNYIIRAA